MAMKDDEFTKLFKYMQEGFAQMNERFETMQDSIDQLRGVVDGLAGQYNTDLIERTAHASQLTRHEHSIDSLDGRVTVLEARTTAG